jgi:hypothetical protein
LPTYEITREVVSPLFVPHPFALGGILFDSQGAVQSTGSVYASAQRTATDMKAAVADFETRLRSVLDIVTIGVLVSTSTYGGSLLVDREDLPYAFFRRLRVNPDSFTLTTSSREQLLGPADGALEALEVSPAFANAARHFRESLIHGSVLVACIHLLRAVEALADKGSFSDLIGEIEYEFFYKKPGMRHHIMHGEEVEQSVLAPHMEALRSAVQDRLRTSAGYTETPFLQRPMSPLSFTPTLFWLVSESPTLSLSTLEAMAKAGSLDFASDPARVRPEQMRDVLDAF